MNQQTQENLLNVVKTNYEDIAEEFNQTRKKVLWPELINLAEQVKDGDKILDVGCGNGRLREAFKNKQIRYVGIDNSQNLIRLAGENEESRIKHQEFFIGDILELSKLDIGSFDYIFCIAVLHHLPGQDLRLEALEQMKKKLSPGGKLILTNWNLWTQWRYFKIIYKYSLLKLIGRNKMECGDILFNWNKGGVVSQRYYHAFTKSELKRLIKKAGFKINKFYKDKFNYYLSLSK